MWTWVAAPLMAVLAALPQAHGAAVADLSLILGRGPGSTVYLGSIVTFTIRLYNSGPMSATNVRAWLDLPVEMSFQSAAATQGSCSRDDLGDVACLAGTLAPGDSVTMTIKAKAAQVGQTSTAANATIAEFETNYVNNSGSMDTKIDPPTEGSREATVGSQLQSRRTKQGLTAPAAASTLRECAKAWAQSMASRHSASHNPNLSSCVGSGWQRLGEIIGKGPYLIDMAKLWMESCDHRTHIWYPHFTHVGVAVAYDRQAGEEYWSVIYADYSSSNGEAVTALQNDCFEQAAITSGVHWTAVRTLGRWHTHADSGGASSRASVSGARSGGYVLSLKDPNPGIAEATQVVRAAAGYRYTLTGYAKQSSGSPQQLVLDFLNSSYGRISAVSASTPSPNGTWRLLTTGAVAPSGTTYIRVVLYGPATSGWASTISWDDVLLTRS